MTCLSDSPAEHATCLKREKIPFLSSVCLRLYRKCPCMLCITTSGSCAVQNCSVKKRA